MRDDRFAYFVALIDLGDLQLFHVKFQFFQLFQCRQTIVCRVGFVECLRQMKQFKGLLDQQRVFLFASSILATELQGRDEGETIGDRETKRPTF